MIQELPEINMKSLRCFRCGKAISKYHLVDGVPVCTDDRLCYPAKNLSKKIKKLAELKAKFASEGM